MELRLDRLLALLRERPDDLLARIDADPMLVRREAGGLVLANASQLLFTPQEQHQLYAKGIVYTRDPYRLVSLPLIKIYNVGERDVTVADLARLAEEPGVRLRFLRKFDGSLVQVFRADGRTLFTTRGMLEGAPGPRGEDPDVPPTSFDFLGEARRLARERYPRLFDDPGLLDGRTLVFEFLHPQARKVTDYGERADLILLAAFDQRRLSYLHHEAVAELGDGHGLTVVDVLSPPGDGLIRQVDHLLASWAGTDEEGAVLVFEREDEVIYRVKVKSPDYLRLMRLMAACTYERTAEILDAHPEIDGWPALEAFLQALGNERVPEEVLVFYREHQECHRAYLADCGRLLCWAEETCRRLEAEVGREGKSPQAFRKEFAARARGSLLSFLLFAQLDGRLDLARLRQSVRTPVSAREALQALGLEDMEGAQAKIHCDPPGGDL
jgi:hypothetical protein